MMTAHHWWMLESLTTQSDIPHLHRNSLAYLLLFFVVIKFFTFLFNLDFLAIRVEYSLFYFTQKKWGLCYVRESCNCNLVCITTYVRNLEPLLVKTQAYKFIFLIFFILQNETRSKCMLACHQPWAVLQAELFTFSNAWGTPPSHSYLFFNDM
jgi:hypothetical protein